MFAKGIPQMTEAIDPLTLGDVTAKAGTFEIKSTNVVVKGLRKMQVKELGYVQFFSHCIWTGKVDQVVW